MNRAPPNTPFTPKGYMVHRTVTGHGPGDTLAPGLIDLEPPMATVREDAPLPR